MKKMENVEGHQREGGGLNGEVWTGLVPKVTFNQEQKKGGMVKQISVEGTFLQTVPGVNPPAACFQMAGQLTMFLAVFSC